MGLDVYNTVCPTRNLWVRKIGLRAATGGATLMTAIFIAFFGSGLAATRREIALRAGLRLTFGVAFGRLFTERLFIQTL